MSGGGAGFAGTYDGSFFKAPKWVDQSRSDNRPPARQLRPAGSCLVLLAWLCLPGFSAALMFTSLARFGRSSWNDSSVSPSAANLAARPHYDSFVLVLAQLGVVFDHAGRIRPVPLRLRRGPSS